MIRCPSCGKRLRDGAPSCAAHGVPPPAPPPAEAPVPFVVPDPDLPAYRVNRLLGQGGFGAVFAAERLSDAQTMAIKVARADNAAAGECLAREAAALASIGSPHVPALYETGKLADGSVYAVMEFVRAPILADRLAAQGGPMPVEEFGRHALAILAILEAAHGKGLVHCDLKPENIFIDDAFGAKLFDFGLVRRAGDQPSESTREEAPAGTPEYMSPEQCEGRVDLDARSDLYALGVIFYEMLAGGPPFWGKPAEVQQNHRSRRPPALGRRTPMAVALEEAVMRCLAKDPERRFASALELRKALQAGLVAERARGEAVAAAPPSDEATPEPGAAAAGARPAAAAKPAAPARERRTVALLFFESKADVASIREAMTSVGAQLAHTAGAQYVLAFGHELGDNPTRAAANAAEMVVARGLTKRALVDLASVSIQARPDGSRRYQSPLFAKKEQYPGDADPLGVLLSPAALEVLPDVPTDPVPARPGVMLLKKATQAAEKTTTRMGVAALVGREEVLRVLLDAARAATGHAVPTITTLIGEAGYGKTHLAQMLVQHLEALPRIQTLFVRAKEVLGGAGEQTTREIYARTLSLPDQAPPDLGRALLSERLGADVAREVWAGVAVTMGWAPPEHPELRALAAAPGALRSAAARAAGEALRQMSRKRPLAVVVEDAHFVDETALDALEYATLKEADCPIWICVVGRPAFGRGRTAWASRAARKHEVTLAALEPAAAAELARRLLAPAENVPASALARLAERTQGIPMLLVELVRGLKRDGLVRKSEKGNTWSLATDELERLPDLPLVQWLSSRETESLPADLLAHARLASMLGVEFSADELEGVLQELERLGASAETQLDASIGLRRLSESGILIRHRGGRVGFRHALLRDTVYQSVPAAQRASIHRAAFDYYRRQDRLPEAQRLPQMAFHASRSGLAEESGKLYLELASRTLARHAYLDAELLFRNAIENLPKHDDLGHITASQGRGLMRFRLGRHEDALKDFNVALERARAAAAVRAQIDILLDEGIVLDWAMDWPQSAAVSEEARLLAQGELCTPLVEARVGMGRGRTLMRQDKLPEAVLTMEHAIEVAGRLGEEGYEPYTQGLSMMAWALACMTRYEDSERAFARCVATFEEHGDMIGLAGALQNRCTLSFLTNSIDRVLADYRRIIQIAREYGFPIAECLATKDLGEIYFLLGRPKEAEPYAQRGIEMYMQTLGETASRVFNAQMLLARIKWYEGDVQAAADVARGILEGQAAARASGKNDSLLTPGELVLIEMVDLALRRADDTEFDALVGKARELTLQAMDMVEIMEFKALAALRAGRRADGVRLLEAALAEADRSARLVSDRIRRQLNQATALAAS
jgi:tetratricopeptide (TPR) repeat protein